MPNHRKVGILVDDLRYSWRHEPQGISPSSIALLVVFVFAAAFLAVVLEAVLGTVLGDVLEDFLRVFLDIRLPFVAFRRSTIRVLRVSPLTVGFAPAAGKV